MKKQTLLIAALILSGCATQQTLTETTSTENLLPFAEYITPDYMHQHLEIIASDEFEGRMTGTAGQKKAANYLAEFYEGIGFTPMGDEGSYFQKFILNADVTDSLVYETYQITENDTVSVSRMVESGSSTAGFVRMFGGTEPIEASVVFAGFGLNDSERDVHHLEGTDLQGKWVLMFEEIPYVVDGDTLVNPEITSNSRVGNILGNLGAQGILLISDYPQSEFEEIAEMASGFMNEPQNMRLAYLDDSPAASGFPKGIIQISPEQAAFYLGLHGEQELFSYKDSLTSTISDFEAFETSYFLDYQPYDGPGEVETENVVAYLEGADPELSHEVVVLMAHYDHVGIGQPDASGDTLYNGADDNGSGTTGLITIANALHQAQQEGYRPKRSILFLHVSAEEIGLLGSRYYSDHPVIPIENTVANYNADMIGRSDPENIEKGDTDYVYLIGGEIISSGLDSLVQEANQKSVDMRLDRRYNDLQDPNQFYRRSDHWNFGRLGVPFVFFFTGVHEDYHRPSDTVDKIDFEKLARVTRLIYTSTLEVANYEGRPEVDNQMFIEITGQQPR